MTRIPFENIPIKETNEPLVDLSQYPFVLEPAYFTQGISPDPIIRVRKGIAEKLVKAQQLLDGKYKLKIWDAHRPRSVQAAIYDTFRADLAQKNPSATDEELDRQTQLFVTKATNPERIPPHATGGTVDLTIVDLEGNTIDMGTEFDHFGPEAAPFYFAQSSTKPEVQKNRQILFDAMAGAGFLLHDDEWWHFDYGNQVWAYKTGQAIAIYGEAFVND